MDIWTIVSLTKLWFHVISESWINLTGVWKEGHFRIIIIGVYSSLFSKGVPKWFTITFPSSLHYRHLCKVGGSEKVQREL